MSKYMDSLNAYLKKPNETYLICKGLVDHIDVQHIMELTKEYEETKENGDLVNQKYYLEIIFSEVEKLSPEMKDKLSKALCILSLELTILLLNDHQYQDAIDRLELTKNMSGYANLETIGKCSLNRLLSYSKLLLGLSDESKDLILEAKELNQKLIKNAGKITSGELKKEILDDKQIIEAWEKDNIKTTIEFEIPFPLIVTDEPIEFEYDDVKHIIEIELFESPVSPIPSKGCFAEIVEDKYGLAIRSKVKLTSFRYVNPYEIIELKILAQDKKTSKAILETIKVMNFFIERYRVTTNNYWLENIFHKMIPNYKGMVTAGNIKIHTIRNFHSQRIKISLGNPWLSQEKLEELMNNLKKDRLDLWNSLLLDAKDYLLRRNYKEAIYAINGAFENYLMLKAQEILSEAWGNKNAMEYLDGIPDYKYHKLKNCMDEETFNKAVKKDLIAPYVPSTYQILKECNIVRPFPISRKKLNKLVDKIRKKRNEVMHGDNLNEDLEIIVFEAIKSFEDFVKLFD